MHGAGFIQDLAMIMLVAGVVTILFHRFKQPVVLGYIIAGVILGPYTPPFQLIEDEHTTQILAELGVVFLMFSLGLEFSLKRLARVGATAVVAALMEIAVMIGIGFAIGRFFDWSVMDSIFLGAMLAISSTTIIIKALDELRLKNEKFAQLIFGILIVEDILAIGMIALLSGIAMYGAVNAGDVIATAGKLSLFMIVSLVLGILIVPRLLAYVAKFRSNEMLLVTVLGLCFGFCLIVLKLNYSIALGAFMIGAIMAEARELRLIERLIEPVRDMFSAIFFVTIGLMFDPAAFFTYGLPIAIITAAVVIGKVLTCSIGTFAAGEDGRTSLKVGMGLAQIGEFSFIIATLGLTLKVTSEFLFPIVVAVSAITTLLTPYLIRLSDPLLAAASRSLPRRLTDPLTGYTAWLAGLQLQGDRAVLARIILRIVIQILVNCALIAAVFIASAYLVGVIEQFFLAWIEDERIRRTIIWSGALLISLPFMIATYFKIKALSMLLAELGIKETLAGRYTGSARNIASEVIPVAAIIGVLYMIVRLSPRILPPPEWFNYVLLAATLIALLIWKPLARLHSRLQIALFKTFEEAPDELK
jgi:CPA2 family monovalent cation:H+ antiporter-2